MNFEAAQKIFDDQISQLATELSKEITFGCVSVLCDLNAPRSYSEAMMIVRDGYHDFLLDNGMIAWNDNQDVYEITLFGEKLLQNFFPG